MNKWLDKYNQEEDTLTFPNGGRLKKKLSKEYPGLENIYGKDLENVTLKKDRNFKGIEFYGSDLPENSDIYPDHPNPEGFGVRYNSKDLRKGGTKKEGILGDLLHGLHYDSGVKPLYEEFETHTRNKTGEDMNHWWNEEKDKPNDGREQWDKNWTDGYLRQYFQPKSKEHSIFMNEYSPEMEQSAEKIKNYLKKKTFKTGGTLSNSTWLDKYNQDTEIQTAQSGADVYSREQYVEDVASKSLNYLEENNWKTPYYKKGNIDTSVDGMNCIYGVCSVIDKSTGVKFSNSRGYTGNSTFRDNASKEGFYEINPKEEGFDVGDIFSYARHKDNKRSRFPGKVTPKNAKDLVPNHSVLIANKEINENGETMYTILNNSGKDAFKKETVSQKDLLERYYKGYKLQYFDGAIAYRYDPKKIDEINQKKQESNNVLRGENEYAEQYNSVPKISFSKKGGLNINDDIHSYNEDTELELKHLDEYAKIYQKSYDTVGKGANMPIEDFNKLIQNQIGIARQESKLGQDPAVAAKEIVPDALLSISRKINEFTKTEDNWKLDYWKNNIKNVTSEFRNYEEFIKSFNKDSPLDESSREWLYYNSPKSKGVFQQKELSERGRHYNLNLETLEGQAMSSLALSVDNYHLLKKKYPNLNNDEIIDLTTLMHNAPNKALEERYVEHYLKNKDIDYVNKVKLHSPILKYSEALNPNLGQESPSLSINKGKGPELSEKEVLDITSYIKSLKLKHGGTVHSNWLDKYNQDTEIPTAQVGINQKFTETKQDNTYRPPNILIPIEKKGQNATLRADTRSDEERRISQEYAYNISNPSVRQQVIEGIQKIVRWTADPLKGFGDIVGTFAPNTDLAKSLPNTNEEILEYRKKQLNPYISTEERLSNLSNEALPLANWSMLNALPGAATTNILKSGKSAVANQLKPVVKATSSVDDVGNLANQFRKNLLSDKELKMYKWFEKQQRFDKLPKTTNKESLGALEDFKTRIQTPEGKKRMKELGIDNDKMLQKLEIVEDPNTFGYYTGDKNKIVKNPLDPLPSGTTRHEIEHGVQNAMNSSKIDKVNYDSENFKYLFNPKKGTQAKIDALKPTSEIDDLLSGLELRREGTPNKVWKGHVDQDTPVNINDYKPELSNKQNATDYFLTGSKGREKSAFLGEVQQYMMDAGTIPKKGYVEITPEMVKKTMIDAMFDEAKGGKYLRLFNIMKASDANYNLVAKGLNKMLGIVPAAIGTGTALKEKKHGGVVHSNTNWLNKYK